MTDGHGAGRDTLNARVRRTLPFLAAGLAALVSSSSREARAGVFIGAQLDGGVSIGAPGVHPGVGFLGALGYRIGLGPVFLQPEVEGGTIFFPGTLTPLHATRILGGARLGLSGKVQPAVYGHAGVGWLAATIDGPSFNAGVSLAFKLVPLFSFGVQGGYDVLMVLASGQATRWFDFGLHAGVEL
jgi:hypothetical protein